MIVTYPCGCEIAHGILWVRACVPHNKLARRLRDEGVEKAQGLVMACIILQKPLHELDAYEDQIIISETYAKLRQPEGDNT